MLRLVDDAGNVVGVHAQPQLLVAAAALLGGLQPRSQLGPPVVAVRPRAGHGVGPAHRGQRVLAHRPRNGGQQVVLPDLVHAALRLVLAVRLAGVVVAHAAGATGRMACHRRTAPRAEHEPGKRQRALRAWRQAHIPAGKLLHQVERRPVHDGLVRAGLAVPLGGFHGHHGLASEVGLSGLALHERAGVDLVGEDADDGTRIPAGLAAPAEVGTAVEPLRREVLERRGHEPLVEPSGDSGGAHAADARVEDAAHDARGLGVHHQLAAVGAGALGVAVGREAAHELAALALGLKRRLGLGRRIAAVHVVEQVLHGEHQRVGRGALGGGVVAVGDGDHAHAQRGEHLLDVARDVQVVAAHAAEVLDDDAVDFAGLYVGDEPVPVGAVVEGRARVAVVGVLADHVQVAFRSGEVADHGVLVEHRAADAVVLIVDGEPGVAGGAVHPGRRLRDLGFGHENTSLARLDTCARRLSASGPGMRCASRQENNRHRRPLCLAQSYHAYRIAGVSFDEKKGWFRRYGRSPSASRTFSRIARKRDTASSRLHSPAYETRTFTAAPLVSSHVGVHSTGLETRSTAQELPSSLRLLIAAADPEHLAQLGAHLGVEALELFQHNLPDDGVRARQPLVDGVHGDELLLAVLFDRLALVVDGPDGSLTRLAQKGYGPIEYAAHERMQLVLMPTLRLALRCAAVGEQLLWVDVPLAVLPPELAEQNGSCRDPFDLDDAVVAAAGTCCRGHVSSPGSGSAVLHSCPEAENVLFWTCPKGERLSRRKC